MEDHWRCPGSKREALIIKLGWDLTTTETPGNSLNSPAVRMCTNTSVSVFQINFCQSTTWPTEVCCVINTNILVVFQIFYELTFIVGGRLQSVIMRTLCGSFFGTAPTALIIVGMWEWSATAKWSC